MAHLHSDQTSAGNGDADSVGWDVCSGMNTSHFRLFRRCCWLFLFFAHFFVVTAGLPCGVIFAQFQLQVQQSAGEHKDTTNTEASSTSRKCHEKTIITPHNQSSTLSRFESYILRTQLNSVQPSPRQWNELTPTTVMYVCHHSPFRIWHHFLSTTAQTDRTYPEAENY